MTTLDITPVDAPAEHATMRAGHALALAAATIVGARVTLTVIGDRVAFTGVWAAVGVAYQYVALFALMAVTGVRGLRLRGRLGRFARAQIDARSLSNGVFCYAAAAVAAIVTITALEAAGVHYESNAAAFETSIGGSRLLLWTFGAAAIIGAPLIEEFFFRGFLQQALTRELPAVAAVGVQAVAFGAYHWIPTYGTANIPMILPLTAIGAAFGTFAYRTGRLGPSIVAHALMNTLAFTHFR